MLLQQCVQRTVAAPDGIQVSAGAVKQGRCRLKRQSRRFHHDARVPGCLWI
jgi:hypothetical protein